MHNDQSGRNVHWHYPGEVVLVARVRSGLSQSDLHARMHASLRRHAEAHVASDSTSLDSLSFRAPGEDGALVFFFQKLANVDSVRAVKDAVEALHAQLPSISSDDIAVFGALPHLHVRAHEGAVGGSPGSYP